MAVLRKFVYNGAIVLPNGVFMYAGVGDPTGVLPAPVGSLYLRSDGSSGTSLYVKEIGTDNAGWTAAGGLGGRVASLSYTIDGGGNTVAVGAKGQITVPTACTITGWMLTSDVSGSAIVDVLYSSYSGFPTTASIASTDKPTLSSAQKAENLSIVAWSTTALSQGDQIQFYVDSATTVTRLNLTILVSIDGGGTGGGGGGGGGGGAQADSVQALSSPATISFDGTLNTVIQATAGAVGITLTLPSAAGVSGQKVTVMMIDTGPGAVTINTASGEFIRSTLSSYALTNQWQTIVLESNNVGWMVVGTAN